MRALYSVMVGGFTAHRRANFLALLGILVWALFTAAAAGQTRSTPYLQVINDWYDGNMEAYSDGALWSLNTGHSPDHTTGPAGWDMAWTDDLGSVSDIVYDTLYTVHQNRYSSTPRVRLHTSHLEELSNTSFVAKKSMTATRDLLSSAHASMQAYPVWKSVSNQSHGLPTHARTSYLRDQRCGSNKHQVAVDWLINAAVTNETNILQFTAGVDDLYAASIVCNTGFVPDTYAVYIGDGGDHSTTMDGVLWSVGYSWEDSPVKTVKMTATGVLLTVGPHCTCTQYEATADDTPVSQSYVCSCTVIDGVSDVLSHVHQTHINGSMAGRVMVSLASGVHWMNQSMEWVIPDGWDMSVLCGTYNQSIPWVGVMGVDILQRHMKPDASTVEVDQGWPGGVMSASSKGPLCVVSGEAHTQSSVALRLTTSAGTGLSGRVLLHGLSLSHVHLNARSTSHLSISGCTIANCWSAGDGGCVSGSSVGSVVVVNGRVEGGIAGGNGGCMAWANIRDSLVVSGVYLSDCWAEGGGGGLALSQGNSALAVYTVDMVISRSYASHGGAIWFGQESTRVGLLLHWKMGSTILHRCASLLNG